MAHVPNFLIIGAAKSGTTSIYNALLQHPQIFMSRTKEPHYFSYAGQSVEFKGPGDDITINQMVVTARQQYEALFAQAGNRPAIGEASTMYLYTPDAPANIYQHYPAIKLIAVLRNPVDRAYSAFQHMRRDGREPYADFLQAVNEQDKRKAAGWSPIFYYHDMGLYSQQLRRYFARFTPQQMLILLYEEIREQWPKTLATICRFLEVDIPTTPLDIQEHNKSGIPKNMGWHQFLRRSHPLKTLAKPFVPEHLRKTMTTKLINRNLAVAPPMRAEERVLLSAHYRDDILCLQEMLKRDLSHWLHN